jgi:hypothetical protein
MDRDWPLVSSFDIFLRIGKLDKKNRGFLDDKFGTLPHFRNFLMFLNTSYEKVPQQR